MPAPMPDGCPWSGFTPPNVDWCEEQLCAWVTNPADTWSNLAYVVLGVWMILETRRASGTPKGELRFFGPASIAVGICSGVYHASYTFMLQILDFVGMFVFCFTVITENAGRLGWIEASRKGAFFAAGVAGFTLLVPLLWATALPYQGLVLVLILLTIGQELAARRRLGPAPSYRFFALALGLLTAAGLFSLADVTRTWCDPTNHWIQGHSIWHVLSASALLALYHHHAQLETRN